MPKLTPAQHLVLSDMSRGRLLYYVHLSTFRHWCLGAEPVCDCDDLLFFGYIEVIQSRHRMTTYTLTPLGLSLARKDGE